MHNDGEQCVAIRNSPEHNDTFMFAWLVDEMANVRTKNFFVVDGPANEELRLAVKNSDIPLPESYKLFVLTFGNAALYRRDSYYYLNVFAGPSAAETDDGEELIEFGKTW